jgi:pyruvate dehydrogenase E1 component
VRRMLDEQCDEFYYLTVMNENTLQPPWPQGVAGLEDDIVRGLYRLPDHAPDHAALRLLGSGTILLEVIAAARLLAQDFGIAAEVWSATSFVELAREAREVQRFNRLHPNAPRRSSHVARCLAGSAPVVAATDYVRALPQLIGEYLGAPLTTLGTDGFGRSDTRKALRRFFEVDRFHIAVAALDALARAGQPSRVAEAIARYGIDADRAAPWLV